jgi:hypothetical protein
VGATAVLQQVTWEEALRAGRVLFGTRADALLEGADWRDELKRAYKRRVLETHPDRAQTLGRAETELAREFQAVADAYRLLQEAPDASGWVRSRPPPAAWRPAPRSGAAEAARARREAEARRTERTERTRQAEQARRHEEEHRARSGRRAEQARRDEEARQAEAARRAADARVAEEAARAAREASARRPRTTARTAEPSPDWRHVPKARPLPRRRVRLAEFLYYTGRISWAAMVEAITWQRRQRPAVGRIAVDFGFLTPLEVAEVIERRWRAGEGSVPFGEFALRIGLITPFERLAMIGRQARLQRPIGQYFVERGLIQEHEFEDLRRQIVRHNLRHYV